MVRIAWKEPPAGNAIYCQFPALTGMEAPTKTYLIKASAEYTYIKTKEIITKIEFGGGCCFDNDCAGKLECTWETGMNHTGVCTPSGTTADLPNANTQLASLPGVLTGYKNRYTQILPAFYSDQTTRQQLQGYLVEVNTMIGSTITHVNTLNAITSSPATPLIYSQAEKDAASDLKKQFQDFGIELDWAQHVLSDRITYSILLENLTKITNNIQAFPAQQKLIAAAAVIEVRTSIGLLEAMNSYYEKKISEGFKVAEATARKLEAENLLTQYRTLEQNLVAIINR
jgi:hypothetical protein